MFYASIRRFGSITIVPRGAACPCPDPWEILKTDYGYAVGLGNGRVLFLEKPEAHSPASPFIAIDFRGAPPHEPTCSATEGISRRREGR